MLVPDAQADRVDRNPERSRVVGGRRNFLGHAVGDDDETELAVAELFLVLADEAIDALVDRARERRRSAGFALLDDLLERRELFRTERDALARAAAVEHPQ